MIERKNEKPNQERFNCLRLFRLNVRDKLVFTTWISVNCWNLKRFPICEVDDHSRTLMKTMIMTLRSGSKIKLYLSNWLWPPNIGKTRTLKSSWWRMHLKIQLSSHSMDMLRSFNNISTLFSTLINLNPNLTVVATLEMSRKHRIPFLRSSINWIFIIERFKFYSYLGGRDLDVFDERRDASIIHI